MAGRYDNSVPSRVPSPIIWLKIPALGSINKRLQIRALGATQRTEPSENIGFWKKGAKLLMPTFTSNSS